MEKQIETFFNEKTTKAVVYYHKEGFCLFIDDITIEGVQVVDRPLIELIEKIFSKPEKLKW
jgi:hypothetical protein